MNVGRLIEMLSKFDSEMEVRISQPTHNYWDEIYAQTIDEVTERIVGYDDNMLYDSINAAENNADGYSWKVVIYG